MIIIPNDFEKVAPDFPPCATHFLDNANDLINPSLFFNNNCINNDNNNDDNNNNNNDNNNNNNNDDNNDDDNNDTSSFRKAVLTASN